MAVFVLVHGAWHGGWCWADTARALRDQGHDVHCPTLTGLGERSHLLTAAIDANTHVTDIVNTLQWRDLRNVVLVGHSYGGMVITGVASSLPDRVRALVYLDAVVPQHSDEPIFGAANPERMAAFQTQIDAGAIGLEPDAAANNWAEDPDTRAWLLSKCTPQPARCFQSGVTLTGREKGIAHRHYIIAAKNKPSLFWPYHDAACADAGWTTDSIPTWHDAMVETPDLLAGKLTDYAAALPEPEPKDTSTT